VKKSNKGGDKVPGKRGGGIGFSVGNYNVGIAYFKRKKKRGRKRK